MYAHCIVPKYANFCEGKKAEAYTAAITVIIISQYIVVSNQIRKFFLRESKLIFNAGRCCLFLK
jgi:hypothetical protein